MAVDFSKQEEGLTLITLPSLESQLAIIEKYEPEFNRLVKEAKDLKVIDDESVKKATSQGTDAKRLGNEIEKRRKEINEIPYNRFTAVNKFCKLFTEKLKLVEGEAGRKIRQYDAQVEQDRRDAEKKANEAAAELQEKLNAEAKEQGIEPEKVQMQTIPEEKTIHRTASGTAHQRGVMTFDPDKVELDKVPRKYLMLDEKKVRAAIKTGIKKIEGITIYEKKSTVFKT